MNFNFNYPQGGPRTELDALVDRATDELRIAPDWSENLDICDKVSSGNDQTAFDACRAIRRRMGDKSEKVALLALTLLEACMKNCSDSFHEQVASKDFQAELTRLASGKGEVAERTLSLIEAWADAFQTGGPTEFEQTYNALRAKGVRALPPDARAFARASNPPRDAGLTDASSFGRPND
jgi:hypothetical protein